MSLVGTRPPTVDEWKQYEPYHRGRLAVKPGLTGMWQVSGRSDITDFEEVVKLDMEYVKNWNIGMDIKGETIKIFNYGNCKRDFPFSKNVHKDVLKAAMFVSTSDYEGISNSMIEAMAIGIPTICTDCPAGGSKMIITDHDNGILVKVGDRQEVVEAMKEIASDVQLSRKLSMNGAMIRDRLSVSKIAQQWMEIL